MLYEFDQNLFRFMILGVNITQKTVVNLGVLLDE
jgi:hypothetical protein